MGALTGEAPAAAIVALLGLATLLGLCDLAFHPRTWQLRRPGMALRAQSAAAALLAGVLVVGILAIAVWGESARVAPQAHPWLGVLPTVTFAAALFVAGGALGIIAGRREVLSRGDVDVDRTIRTLIALSERQQRRGDLTISYIDAAHPFACAVCVDGPHVLITSGLRRHLTHAQIEAIVAHEAHHLTAGHDRHLRRARLAAACLPVVTACRRHERRVRLLIELASDDHAARHCGAVTTAQALESYQLAAPTPGTTERARRLRDSMHPASSGSR